MKNRLLVGGKASPPPMANNRNKYNQLPVRERRYSANNGVENPPIRFFGGGSPDSWLVTSARKGERPEIEPVVVQRGGGGKESSLLSLVCFTVQISIKSSFIWSNCFKKRKIHEIMKTICRL